MVHILNPELWRGGNTHLRSQRRGGGGGGWSGAARAVILGTVPCPPPAPDIRLQLSDAAKSH